MASNSKFEKFLNISIICGLAVMLLLAGILALSYITPDDSMAKERRLLENHPLVNGTVVSSEANCVSCHQHVP